MTNQIEGHVFPCREPGQFYLQYCFDGEHYEMTLRDKDGNVITDRKTAELAAEEILARMGDTIKNELHTTEGSVVMTVATGDEWLSDDVGEAADVDDEKTDEVEEDVDDEDEEDDKEEEKNEEKDEEEGWLVDITPDKDDLSASEQEGLECLGEVSLRAIEELLNSI